MYRLSSVPTFEFATSFRLHLSDLIDASIQSLKSRPNALCTKLRSAAFPWFILTDVGQQWYRLCFRWIYSINVGTLKKCGFCLNILALRHILFLAIVSIRFFCDCWRRILFFRSVSQEKYRTSTDSSTKDFQLAKHVRREVAYSIFALVIFSFINGLFFGMVGFSTVFYTMISLNILCGGFG